MGKHNKKNKKKKNKQNKQNKQNEKEQKSVSIVTPTMDSRVDYLEILILCILQQDYNNIIEWIIVDGSQNDNHVLRQHIDRIRNTHTDLPEIVFLEPPPDNNKTIGALRNLYNERCRGDIIVCMDDDDYYPETRVSHCVDKLTNSNDARTGGLEIGACAGLCIYSIEFQKVYEWKRFHINQGGNASIAYTHAYAKTHTYDAVACGEEKTFVKNYMGYGAEPGKENEKTMIQFDKEHSLLSIAHSSTYKKSKIFYMNEIRPQDKKFVYNSNFSLGSYIKNTKILKMYKKLFKKDDFENEDVTIIHRRDHTALTLSKPLIHSEFQQMNDLCTHLIQQGKSVVVYTDIEDEEQKTVDGIKIQDETIHTINNVRYKHIYTLDSRQKFKDLIVVGKQTLDIVPILNIKYNRLHFINTNYVKKINNNIFDDVTIQTFINRSTHLKESLLAQNSYLKKMLDSSIHIPLGIHKSHIDKTIQALQKKKITRNRYRFCYTNSYENGLLPIIQYIYPTLKKLQPKIELHLYGELNPNLKPHIIKEFEKYIDQSGIVDHGLCPLEDIIEEKLTSGFHLYYSDKIKYDSMSVKESVYCECIPIISSISVFKDLIGCHFTFNPESVQSYINVANIISQTLNDDIQYQKLHDTIRSNSRKMPTMEDNHALWDNVLG